MERMNLSDLDARSAALGGVAGLGLGGLVGWLAASHLSRRRLQAELVSLKDHYDSRLVRLQTQVNRFERSERLRREEEAAVVARAAELIASQGYSSASKDTDDWPGNPVDLPGYDSSAESQRLSAVGREDSADGFGEEPGDPDDGGSRDSDVEISEVPRSSGPDSHPGSVTPDKSKPFVISDEAFGELAEEGFDSMTITYYIGDGVLADNRDQPIPNILMTTGPLSRESFGVMSGDDRIVYIRNYKLEHDFEVILHDGKWTDLVGLSDDRGDSP